MQRIGRVALAAAAVVALGLTVGYGGPPDTAPGGTPAAGAAAGAAGAGSGTLAARPAAGPGLLDRPPGSLPVSRAGEEGLWLSWALLDTSTGTGPDARWTGSANAATERTLAESTIKAWIAADTLRAAAEDGRAVTAAEREAVRAAIRSSDDDAAERLYRRGGTDAMIDRLDPVCGVDVAPARPGWWSFTRITARDAAAILGCVVTRAPSWPGGADLLTDLRTIDPDGRSGVAALVAADARSAGAPLGDGPPSADAVAVAEKNGWTRHGGRGEWNVNCVLAWPDRALAVLTSYPADRGLEYGWGVCRDVAADVLAAPGG